VVPAWHTLVATAILLLCTPLASLAGNMAGRPAQHPLVALAVAHEHGEGVAKDPLKAAGLYCEAARAGDAEAQYSLGWMYANGRGIERDDTAAAALFALAAAQGHADAERMLVRVGGPSEGLPECMRPKVEAPEPAFTIPADWPPHKQRVATLVRDLAPQYTVHPELALAVIAAESNFDPGAVSRKGARGLMQLMPHTAEALGVGDPFQPAENVRGGTRYLRHMLDRYGDLERALAAYNAGPSAVDRFGGVPPYPETRDYVKRVMTYYRVYDGDFAR
jgi:soluble lytic murein transglycosylase-like protein